MLHPTQATLLYAFQIWHPNISSVTGAICLDILKDQWAAAMTLRTVLLSLQALLAAPEPDDPQDAVVARQYQVCYLTCSGIINLGCLIQSKNPLISIIPHLPL